MSDHQHLLKNRQFAAAAAKIISSRLPGSNDARITAEVTDVVRAALKANSGDLREIMRKHRKWVDEDVAEQVTAHLLETTAIDPVDDLDETDLSRLRVD